MRSVVVMSAMLREQCTFGANRMYTYSIRAMAPRSATLVRVTAIAQNALSLLIAHCMRVVHGVRAAW